MFTTMCSKEQQTSDNLIVQDYCFIIEIFDKFSFSGILRGCLKVGPHDPISVQSSFQIFLCMMKNVGVHRIQFSDPIIS